MVGPGCALGERVREERPAGRARGGALTGSSGAPIVVAVGLGWSGPQLEPPTPLQTALCYGLVPLEQPITLEHPVRPQGSSYAYSKTAGEQYIDMTELDYISFRLATAYGPRNISGPLPTFYHRLTNSKPCFVMDTRRDFIYIDDLVDVVIKAIDGAGQRGAYHISSGSDFAIKELFDATIKALDIHLDEEVEVRPRTDDDTYTILLDPSKTNQEFGWQTTTPLETGVKQAIDYYTKFGIEETYTHLRMEEKPEPAAV